MKKILPSITLALASLAGFGGFANAGHTFGLFVGCHCCKACGGTITLRQYNAFSPVACGSMMFQGCVVAPPPAAPTAYPGEGFINGFSGDCADGSCGGEPVSQLPTGAFPNNGYAYSYPIGTYQSMPTMQMSQMQMPQMQMPQMQQMQQPMQYQALPASARLP
jgi:hypothetical protein